MFFRLHKILIQIFIHFQPAESKLQQSGVEGYREFMSSGIKNSESIELIDLLRKSNKGVNNKNQYTCWVIGDPEFVKKVMDNDSLRRINLLEYSKRGLNVSKIAQEAAKQMKISPKKIHIRSRGTEISALRKIVAAVSCRRYGIPLVEVANYYGIGSPSVSRMLDEGEKLIEEYKIRFDV